MKKEKVLDKIKKLMALGQSPNPHEAALALQRVRELMDKYGLSQMEVALADISEHTAKTSHKAKTLPSWLGSLAYMVADTFGCEVLLSGGDNLSEDTERCPESL